MLKSQVNALTCEDVSYGWFIPSNTSCADFIQCLKDEQLFGTCPDGFLFNFDAQLCDFPENVNCDIEPPLETTTDDTPITTIPTITTTESNPETTTPDSEVPLVDCPEDEALFVAHPSSCSQYFLCFHGVPSNRTCPAKYHFDFDRQTCVTRDHTDCRLEDPECPEIDDPLHPTFLPHPHFCNMYFLCYNGELRRYQCFDDDHWDPVNETCAPSEIVDCNK